MMSTQIRIPPILTSVTSEEPIVYQGKYLDTLLVSLIRKFYLIVQSPEEYLSMPTATDPDCMDTKDDSRIHIHTTVL